MFCALTGHPAFERRSGEQVVAQFLRITTAPVPDPRVHGVPDDISTIIENSMARDPHRRPSAAALAEQLRQARSGRDAGAAGPRGAVTGRAALPVELTSFVGRRSELAEVRNSLAAGRLVTLIGIGGVGKTRLATRAAGSLQRSFPDGVCLIELAEVRDPAFAVDTVATALGVRDYAGRPLLEALVETLSSRMMLLVLDNCEQIIGAVADLVGVLRVRCPYLHILATSREPLGLGGEAVVRVKPLSTPSRDQQLSSRPAARSDAVVLFVERAAAVVPGFEVTENNNAAIAAICERLDGLPLAIELAAARLRALSVDQILQRLTDRYTLLTRSYRGAPPRQQTLRLSIEWSYDLCTSAEQRLWGELSLFVGSFDLDDVEHVCSGTGEIDLLDHLTSLVDKSIVLREEAGGAVRFRMFESVAAFGRDKIEHTDGYAEHQRRHLRWYQQLAADAEADWFSPRQLDWIARLKSELPNLRVALEYALTETGDAALQIATDLHPLWICRGLFAEGLRWLGRALDHPGGAAPSLRARALYVVCMLAGVQGDLSAVTACAGEARGLETPSTDSTTRGYIAAADGTAALRTGDLDRAQTSLERAIENLGSHRQPTPVLAEALQTLGWTELLRGRISQAVEHHERALAISKAHGEFIYRGYALWATANDAWRRGDRDRATDLLEKGLRLTRRSGDPLVIYMLLQALAWLVAEHSPRRAATITGAAQTHRRFIGNPTIFVPTLLGLQQQFENTARRQLGGSTYDAAYREGAALDTEAAIAYALGEHGVKQTTSDAGPSQLTKREGQVADLIAQGLTNKAIAGKLVISPRTVEGHVDHILAKLGFTSRAQIAAWITGRQQR